MIRPIIREVDPLTAGQGASDVLTESWPAPSLCYSGAYLHWQLSFPGTESVRASAVAALDGTRWVGFAAATPRRVLVSGRFCWIHLVSFVAVRPEARGLRLASALYDGLLGRLLEQPTAGVVTFGQDDSAGLAALQSAYRRANYSPVELGSYRPLGMILPGAARAIAPHTAAPTTPAIDRGALVANAPAEAAWRHYLADPRGARWAASADSDAGAVLVQAERKTARGSESFVLLSNTFGEVPPASGLAGWTDVLSAVAQGATRFASWPNARAVDPATAKACGWRVFPGGYRGFLFLRPGETTLLGNGYTNLEVA